MEPAGAGAVPAWPRLAHIGLALEHQTSRLAGIGGSDANVILSGDGERFTRLWREKRGEAEPENLSSVLPGMLGSRTEAFNRQWFERETEHLVRRVGATDVCQRHD